MTLTQLSSKFDQFNTKLKTADPTSRYKLLLAQYNLLNEQLAEIATDTPNENNAEIDPDMEVFLVDAKDQIVQSMAELECDNQESIVGKLELWKQSLLDEVREDNLLPRDLLVLASLEALRNPSIAA